MTELPSWTVVTAELGSNHGGSLERALEGIREAARVGANGVKFQLFSPEKIYPEDVRPRGRFQTVREDWVPVLAREAEDQGVLFGVSIFEPVSDDIVDHLGYVKLASRSYRDERLHLFVADVLESYGDLLAFVSIPGDAPPLLKPYRRVLDRVCFLVCVPRYPTPPWEAGLPRVRELAEGGVWTGYSDHTPTIFTGGVAVACGARVLEKHFRWGAEEIAPDVGHSLDPERFREYVRFVRHVEDLMRVASPSWGELEHLRGA